MTLFALIHSPFVGPVTWKLVAQVLESRKHQVIIPRLSDDTADTPFWEQHARAAANAIREQAIHEPCVLVAHSGAGPLLPNIGALLNNPVAAYIFVDAGLPQPCNRLEMIRVELPERAGELEQFLKSGGRYPRWSDADLQTLIPNEFLRQQMLKEITPRGMPFFTESLPVPEEWDSVPCGYIQFSKGYKISAEQARKKGWPVIEFQAGHFHMLVEPATTANALIEMTLELGILT